MHPEIGSLVRAKDELWALLEKQDYPGSLRKMRVILSDIKKADVPDELFNKVMKEGNKLASMNDERQRREYLRGAANAYWDWSRETIQILWDKKYLENAKYGPIRKQSRIPFNEDDEE